MENMDFLPPASFSRDLHVYLQVNNKKKIQCPFKNYGSYTNIICHTKNTKFIYCNYHTVQANLQTVDQWNVILV